MVSNKDKQKGKKQGAEPVKTAERMWRGLPGPARPKVERKRSQIAHSQSSIRARLTSPPKKLSEWFGLEAEDLLPWAEDPV
jgi:hypothetical protein